MTRVQCKQCLIGIFMGMVLPFSARAQGLSESRLRVPRLTPEPSVLPDALLEARKENSELIPPQGQNLQTLPKLRSATPQNLEGQIRMEGLQYLSDFPEAPELSSSRFLSARLISADSFDAAPTLSYGVEVAAGTFFKRSQTNYAVQELSLTSQAGEHFSGTFGRHRLRWSELDARWQLGLWQPKYAIDALRPEAQGLTGLFLNYSQGDFELVGFATPMFIPTMGPDIREEEGSLKSDSRWYRQAGNQVSIGNRINTIAYRLDIPEISKLVVNPASALMARWGHRDSGWWTGAAWGYKPVNELLLKRQVVKIIDRDNVDVTVSPDIAYHSVLSADIGYSFENVRTSVSYLEDRPRSKSPDEDWVIQQLQPMQAASAQMDWALPWFSARRLQLQMGVLKVNGGSIVDVQADGSPDSITLFESRLMFTNAFSVGLQGEILNIDRKALAGKVNYLYDSDQRGSMINTEFQFYPDRHWALIMGADVLGVEDETQVTSSFLSQFRANDRIYGGLTYVF